MKLNRYYLVRKNNKVYCSKCGKPVLDDTYLFQRHQKDCVRKVNWVDEHGVEFEDVRNAYKEDDLHVYEIKIENDLLIFNVYQLKMVLMPGWKDKYSGSGWDIIFTAVFNHDSRIVEEHGLYNADVWMKMMIDQRHDKYIGDNPLKVINEYFPSVKEIYNYGMFLDLYREKGYKYNNIDIDIVENLPLHNDVKKTYEHRIGDDIILECYLEYGEDKTTVFISKNFIHYVGESIPYSNLINIKYVPKEKEITEFVKTYPELMVSEYLNSGGTCLFSIILSSNYHKFVEMVGKAGMGKIADNYDIVKDNINIHTTNIQGMFGFNVKQCKKLNSSLALRYLGEKEFIKGYAAALKYQPGITSVTFNDEILRFIIDKFGKEDNAFNEFSPKDVMTVVRYMEKATHFNYDYYKDYINTCRLLDNYVCGKTPKDLYIAHDKVLTLYQLKADEVRVKAFMKAISNKKYASLESAYKENEDDDVVESSQYEIIIPHGPMDLQNESDHLGHCVKTYVDRVINGNTYILFLREVKNKVKPFATIEVQPDYTLIQLKAHSNRHAPISAQEYVKKWAKFKGVKISSFDFD